MAFPCLTNLTLRNCFFLEGYLRDMFDAAPALTSLTLVNIKQRAAKPPCSDKRFYDSDYFMLPFRLRCPTVNALVLVTYVAKKEIKASAAGGSGIEPDMPNLRFFRFQGYPIQLSLTSSAPGLARVDFDVAHRHQGGCEILNYEPLSGMIASFSSVSGASRTSWPTRMGTPGSSGRGFLEQLHPGPDGEYQYMNNDTAAATARLLRSCPVMSELRLRLAMRYNYWYDRKHEDPVRGPFGESMDRFERLACRSSAVDLGGVSELPDPLTNNCAFRCLQTSLRKVTLRFKAKEVNCFPVQLAKFLAENAMVLEEMHVEDGNQFWTDHLCHKVGMWRAESFRRKNLPDTAAGFRVCQLLMDKPVGNSNVKDTADCNGYDYDWCTCVKPDRQPLSNLWDCTVLSWRT
uniref:Uncharacterized protein n=1 Tax=Aegilops tauschii TaxID=37682 RepID=M8CFF4_AEGTA